MMSHTVEEVKPNRATRIVRIISVTLGLLLIPFIAMQFSDEVNWSLADFVIMGVLLFATGLALDFVMSTFKSNENRVWAVIAILLVFLFIWAELAVGLVGSPFAGS